MKKVIKDMIAGATTKELIIEWVGKAWVQEKTNRDDYDTLKAKVSAYLSVLHPLFKEDADVMAAFETGPVEEAEEVVPLSWAAQMVEDIEFQITELKKKLPFRSIMIQSIAHDCRITKGPEEGALLKILEGDYVSPAFIQSEISQLFNEQGATISYRLALDMQKNFSLHTYNALNEDEFTLRALPGDDRWTTFRCEYSPSASPCPTWDRVLGRMENPDTWLAFIYGVYTRKYEGRQTLYWKGPPLIWKSIILKCIIENLFGENLTASLDQTNAQRNQFFSSQFQGKQYLIVPDTKQTGYFLRGEFLSLSSGGHDSMTIEAKYKTAISQRVKLNMIITSNLMFRLNSTPQVTSRVLPVFSFGEPMVEADLEQKLRDELPGMLELGRLAFEARYDTEGRAIILSEKDEELQARMISSHYSLVTGFVEETMEVSNDEKDTITLKLLRRAYDNFALKDSLSLKEMIKEITEVYAGVNEGQDKEGALCLTGLKKKVKPTTLV